MQARYEMVRSVSADSKFACGIHRSITYMVGSELRFNAILGESVRACHNTSIVQEKVEREVLGLEFTNELSDRCKRKQVQLNKLDLVVLGLCLDLFNSSHGL